MRNKDNLGERLILSPLLLTNKTTCFGPLGFPGLSCNTNILPDYIALYTQPSDYRRTENTCVAFYNYDNTFDGKNGLYNAVLYGDIKAQTDFIKRFEGVKFFIAPDYSLCGDCQPYRNYFQMGKAREVALWLTLNCNAIVFPNISCARPEDFPFVLEGYDDVSSVAFSTKGKVRNKGDNQLLQKLIHYTVDHMPQLKNIVVYDVTTDNSEANALFKYASECGINICIPNNMMKIQNRLNQIRRHAHEYT